MKTKTPRGESFVRIVCHSFDLICHCNFLLSSLSAAIQYIQYMNHDESHAIIQRPVTSRFLFSVLAEEHSQPCRTSLSYVEQVQLHFDELEIFRQQVNRFPKEFERYIDFKRTLDSL